MNKRVGITLACVLALAGAGGAWWWSSAQARGAAKAAPSGPAPALVTVATAQRQDVPVTLQVNGSVVSLNSVELRPQVTNPVREVHVKEGQFVKAGQLLFSLDDRADQANLAKARAQQQRDQATLADLERQYRRSQELVAQNFIAKSAAEATLSQLEAQRAAVAADRAAVQAAEVALSYDTLRAPVAGRIGAVAIYPGTLVQPSTVMVTITQLDPIAVSFPVPEGRLPDLLQAAREGSPVEALVPGLDKPLLGKLNFVDNTVDPQVGTVRAKAEFANAGQRLWPGQFVQTRVSLRTLSGATVIPSAALMMSPEGSTVFVIDAQGRAAIRKVQPVHTFDTRVAVRGLEPGETVVIEGKQNVRPGGPVRIESGAPARGATSDAPAAAAERPAGTSRREPA